MESLVHAELDELSTAFRDALSNHLQSFNDDSQTCGYAIVLGEDIDQLNAIAVTNHEEDVTSLDDPSFADEYRYSPDEWQHWHHDAFDSFNDSLNSIYELFRNRHPQRDDDSYSDEEQAYLINVCNMYLGAAVDCARRGDFGGIGYRLIWISDCEYPVIPESIRQLNDPAVVKRVFG